MSTGCAGFPPAVRADRRRDSIPPPLARGQPQPARPTTRPAVPRADGSTPPMVPRIVASPPPLVLLLALLVLAWCSPAPHACRAALAPARAPGAQPPPPTAKATPGTAGVGEAPRRSSPLRVAQCRARCLQRFSGGPSGDAVCLQGPDCFMCWENCELLQSNYAVWGAMCTEKGICFPGCQQACSFHQEEERWGGENRQMVPVVHTRGHQVVEVVVMTSEGGSALVFVRWPPRPSRPPRSANVVYILMTRAQGAASWMQVTQTVDLEARLGDSPSAAHRLDIRVLVVGPEGLVTIYSPADGQSLLVPTPTPATLRPRALSSPPPDRPSPRDPPQGEGPAGGRGGWPLIIREAVTSPLDDAQLALLFPTASADQVAARQQQPPSGPWVLREMSLIHQRVLVIAEVSWEARRGGGVYLVTWEVDGGGLKGNLFTQTTSVTLSLWPLTLYHIQVEVASRIPGDPQPPDRSQVLHLDTRRAAPVVLADPQQVAPKHLGTLPPATAHGGRRAGKWAAREVLAGSGAALVVVALLLAAWRWCGARLCAPTSASPLPGSGEEDQGKEQLRGKFLFMIRSFTEAIGGAKKTDWQSEWGDGRSAMASGGGGCASSIPTVSGRPRDNGQSRIGQKRWLQHPESYADAFLREAERRARNEVQV